MVEHVWRHRAMRKHTWHGDFQGAMAENMVEKWSMERFHQQRLHGPVQGLSIVSHRQV